MEAGIDMVGPVPKDVRQGVGGPGGGGGRGEDRGEAGEGGEGGEGRLVGGEGATEFQRIGSRMLGWERAGSGVGGCGERMMRCASETSIASSPIMTPVLRASLVRFRV